LSSFAAVGAVTLLVIAGCSSDDKKTTIEEGGGGAAEQGGAAPAAAGKGGATTPKAGGAAGQATTPPSAGSAGKAPTAGGAPPAGAGTAGTTPTSSVAGGGAGAVAGTGPVAQGGVAGGATAPKGGTTAAGSPSTGGAVPGGAAGTAPVTTGGVAPVAGAGGAGPVAGNTGVAGSTNPPAGAKLEDLIDALCGWEFKCCDAGERKWQLGPTVADRAACKDAFTYLLNNDNTKDSPYPGTLYPLLTTLGYSINPSRVTPNPTGIQQCITEVNARVCNPVPPDKAPAPTHCTATTFGAIAACDLSNLVKPKQVAGDPCNAALAPSPNDIECVVGTTCVLAGGPDNPSATIDTCVTRGVAGAVCTSDTKCDYGFYCDTTGTGKCTAKAGPGEACSYKDEVNPVAGDLIKKCKDLLTCNPVTKTCVEFCKTGSLCTGPTDDFSCPTGQSCIPISVGTTNTLANCAASGPTNTKCDSAEDCGSGYFCVPGTPFGTCKAVIPANEACTGIKGECGPGLYCNGTNCVTYKATATACTPATGSITSTECDPTSSIGCVYKWNTTTSAAEYLCSAVLLDNGERCGGKHDCKSGKCEYATTAAANMTCIAGAALGQPCIAGGATAPGLANNQTSCAAGLSCQNDACVAQAGPGGTCGSVDTGTGAAALGTPDNDMCKNSVCDSTTWKDAVPTMCTDAIVSKTNGGTNQMCDGAT